MGLSDRPYQIQKLATVSEIMKLHKIGTLQEQRAELDDTFLRKNEFGLCNIQL